ncbi:anti-sigma factor [Sutcliffiella horikoshii]|uniref:anti-sigma factor n=1 Tax=Sutcliffiella horikoshii TaxID=79883 RepID=UPI00203A538D|nr:anti-sigma factor [Sutcliffiella horikoshii]MCM3619327.1 anti-sigma factor [Sutcliffiella horikoshii]
MNDDFKRKLELYDKDEMTSEEKKEFEKEMDAREEQWMKSGLDKTKQRKILRASKWKARIGTALSALAFLFLILIIASFVTNFYYYGISDTENRAQKLSNIIQYGTLITDPYGVGRANNQEVGTFFTMNVTKDLKKIVGKEELTVGEMKVNFFFSKMGFPEIRKFKEVKDNEYQLKFNHPDSNYEYAVHTIQEWNRLEMLPEGTVATAFISFDKIVPTQEVFERFENRDLDILWFPVDVYSKEGLEADVFSLEGPIGFPNNPILHPDDWTLESRTEERSFFGSQVSETHSAIPYEEGDVEILHNQFMKTLRFLEHHESEFDKLRPYSPMKLNEKVKFLESNGINHYGVVITGPSKEILALKDEEWVESLHIDEVALWNWNN